MLLVPIAIDTVETLELQNTLVNIQAASTQSKHGLLIPSSSSPNIDEEVGWILGWQPLGNRPISYRSSTNNQLKFQSAQQIAARPADCSPPSGSTGRSGLAARQPVRTELRSSSRSTFYAFTSTSQISFRKGKSKVSKINGELELRTGVRNHTDLYPCGIFADSLPVFAMFTVYDSIQKYAEL
ncbi:hypothetical protein CHS0354_011638 [Potamilus streckersoni]|uniref:Uncharacterized protein n=1 Tax=Potamilus streckersoni TaxID=2493646 RepID=A0AAE0TKD3_9BIVA|nr:hypothetical protein CHS0354_011638 [Potamilus streckersoni]